MRETCARVLAAALMTGAIAFALAMPAIFDTARNAARSLTTPPSFLQRSVDVTASAPSHSARSGRLEETQPIPSGGFVLVSRSGSVRNGSTLSSGRNSARAGLSKPAPKPAPKPTPKPTPKPAPTQGAAPDTRELADSTAPAAVSSPAASQPAATPSGKGKAKKKGQEHAKNKGKPTPVPQPPVAVTTPELENEPAPTEKDHGNDKDKDKDKEKGKSNDNGHKG